MPGDDATRSVNPERSCPECGGEVTQDNQDVHCQDCGIVISDKIIDHGPEWRSYSAEERSIRSRTEGSRTTTEVGLRLGSQIAAEATETSERDGKRSKQKVDRLRQEHHRSRVQGGNDDRLEVALEFIQKLTISSRYNDSTRETAAMIFREASVAGLLSGRTLEPVAAASVLLAARVDDIGLTAGELAKKDGVEVAPGRIIDLSKTIIRELDFDSSTGLGRIDAERLVPMVGPLVGRVAVMLENTGTPGIRSFEHRAHTLIEHLDSQNGVGGKKPIGVAAAALYAASIESDTAESPTQRETAEAVEVSTDTISKRFQDIRGAAIEADDWGGD